MNSNEFGHNFEKARNFTRKNLPVGTLDTQLGCIPPIGWIQVNADQGVTPAVSIPQSL
jgi:hypothetical protein